MSDTEGRSKGSFGAADLPIAKQYVYPGTRNRMIWIGAGLGGLVALVLLGNLGFGSGGLVANGELSSAHANLDTNCTACHTSFESVVDRKCSLCHESLTDILATYGFDAHYVYESGDRSRAFRRENEVACAACHVEHGGRNADLLATVTAARCERCHDIGNFHVQHPEFDFAAEAIPDDAALTFTHIEHVQRVLDDRDSDDLQQACLTCHVPTPDARNFEPITFAACQDCHLKANHESEELPIQPDGTSLVHAAGEGVVLELGVETLESVRNRFSPGEQWASEMSAAQFEVDDVDDIVVKLGVIHADPWVLHNLRRLRRVIYPAGGLSDLLVVSADVAPADERELYQEALSTLRAQADGLRGRDEEWIQESLFEIDRLTGELERRVSDPNTTLNDARFRIGLRDPRLSDDQLVDIDDFAALVAQPCAQCHTIERATIARVSQDQRVLRRARFDHGAHVIQRGCLDCHTSIPIDELLGASEIDPMVDSATIQNVPTIETCRECHAPNRAADRCLTCHEFHPDQEPHSRLLR